MMIFFKLRAAVATVAICVLLFFSSASLARCPAPKSDAGPPKYPPELLKQGASGTTVLHVTVDACGDPVNIVVAKSSGYFGLDEAAIEAVKNWRLPKPMNGAETGVFQLPIEFIDDVGLNSMQAQATETMPNKGDALRSASTADNEIVFPAFVADKRSIGFAKVNEALGFLRAPCSGPQAKMRGCRTESIRESDPEVVKVTDACDESYWLVFSESSGLGPSVVRERFYSEYEMPRHLRASYLCEGEQAVCDRLLEALKQRPNQPQPPPPALPPPPAGMCD